MSNKGLFLLVEGNDDERFFRHDVIGSKFKGRYAWVKIWKYSQQSKQRVRDFLKSIKAMGADYIYFKDIDQAPCVTDKKEKVFKACNSLKTDRIIIVVREIESWYLAGLDVGSAKRLSVDVHRIADQVSKEEFDRLIPRKYSSRIYFMTELLKYFSLGTAKQKNTSFKYFCKKYEL